MVQVSKGSVVFLFRIGTAVQSRQKVLFHFPSNSVLSRVCSTSPLVKAHLRCCWGKPASPLMYQSSGCTSLWFWPHFRPRSEQGLHPVTFGSMQGGGVSGGFELLLNTSLDWVLLEDLLTAASRPVSEGSVGPGDPGWLRALARAAVLALPPHSASIAQGNPFLSTPLWVLAVYSSAF